MASQAKLIDGRKVSEIIRAEVREDVQAMVEAGQRRPFLEVVQVGSDPASTVYIGAKTRACEDVGIGTHTTRLQDTVSAQELKDEIRRLNEDDDVDGILVQLPLPSHLSALDVIETIDHRKDVDGFHPMNVGRLAIGQPTFRSCTPAGIFELLRHYSIPVKGKHAVVVGASNIVGSPAAIMFSRENDSGKATTTICHKYTQDLTKYTISADILVVAAGVPGLIRGEMVKEGVVVIILCRIFLSSTAAKNRARTSICCLPARLDTRAHAADNQSVRYWPIAGISESDWGIPAINI